MKGKIQKIKIISIAACSITVFLFFLFILILSNKKQKQPQLNSEKLILGFSQIGSESAWRTRNTDSIFEAAAENDIQILFDDAQQKQENQLKAIRSFIVYQVDVIAFVPIVEDGWDNVLQEAKDANIPVIVVDRKIKANQSLYAGFIGENGVEEGRRAARYLLNKCRNSEGPVNIFEITGTENSSIVEERASGFREIIGTHSKFRIILSENGDFLRSRGREIGDMLLASNVLENGNTTNTIYYNKQKIDVIFSHNDSMTLGFLDSMEAHKINPKGYGTIIISIDAEQESIDALIAGKLNCVVECNPNHGQMLMALVKQVAKGESIPRITYNFETVFTEDDNFDKYDPRGY